MGSIYIFVFRVVGGLDTLDKMEKIKTDDKDRPLVGIRSSLHKSQVWQMGQVLVWMKKRCQKVVFV